MSRIINLRITEEDLQTIRDALEYTINGHHFNECYMDEIRDLAKSLTPIEVDD